MVTVNKKKLFIWSDAPCVCTGFGNVAKNLFRDLHQDFDVEILGINYHGVRKYDTSKYFIYPVAPPDMLGLQKLPMLLEQIRPDIFLGFQDIFHLNEILPIVRDKAPQAKVVTYFPIDGYPVSPFWKNSLEMSDVPITYTEWARRIILERFPEYEPRLKVMLHGVDTESFHPLDERTRRILGRSFGWYDKFSVININRFQPRKFVDGSIRAFYMLYKGYNICSCGNYYPSDRAYCDLNGCSKNNAIASFPGHGDVTLYLHMHPQELAMGPLKANTLNGHLLNIGFTDEDISKRVISFNTKPLYTTNSYSEEDLNAFYNAACVNISSAVGEGFGLSLVEAMATGTRSIAPYNSAIPEVLNETGRLVPNHSLFTMAGDNGHWRPVVDVGKMLEALKAEYDIWQKNNRQKIIDQDCLNTVNLRYNWSDKREFLLNILKEISN